MKISDCFSKRARTVAMAQDPCNDG
jgi:hypothetical protein